MPAKTPTNKSAATAAMRRNSKAAKQTAKKQATKKPAAKKPSTKKPAAKKAITSKEMVQIYLAQEYTPRLVGAQRYASRPLRKCGIKAGLRVAAQGQGKWL